MKKYTPVFVLGVILLFLGVTVSPITAENYEKDSVSISYIEKDNVLSTLTLTDIDIQELESMLSELMDQIQSAPDYDSALSIIEDFMMRRGKNPKFATLFSYLMKTMIYPREYYQISPFMKNVLVMSSGYTNKLIPFRGTRTDMHQFLLFWFYSQNSNLLVSSRTTIIDPYPFNIKNMVGRQVGVLRGFTGIYIAQHSNIANKDYTFFMGRARCAIGYDFAR